MDIKVELGWPIDGDMYDNVKNAMRFNQGLLQHIMSGIGIFELDRKPKYQLDLAGILSDCTASAMGVPATIFPFKGMLLMLLTCNYQVNSQNVWDCDFNGLAMITNQDPLDDSYEFSIMIDYSSSRVLQTGLLWTSICSLLYNKFNSRDSCADMRMTASQGRGEGNNRRRGRKKRFWTYEEDANGYMNKFKEMIKRLHLNCGLKADPNIDSRIKHWSEKYSAFVEMLSTFGFGWDVDKKMLQAEKTVFDEWVKGPEVGLGYRAGRGKAGRRGYRDGCGDNVFLVCSIVMCLVCPIMRESESLPRGIVANNSNLEMRLLWGLPKKCNSSQSLLAMAVGIKQIELVNAMVGKEFWWNDRVVHVSAINQTKWWFAKRFMHPDVVAAYEYNFLWDEDLGVDDFDPLQYISIVKEEGLQISQPALDGNKSEVHHQITARGEYTRMVNVKTTVNALLVPGTRELNMGHNAKSKLCILRALQGQGYLWMINKTLGNGQLVAAGVRAEYLSNIDLALREPELSITQGSGAAFLTEIPNWMLIGLEVYAVSIVGPLPIAVTNLLDFQRLDLHNNKLTGPIPPQIGRLKRLKKTKPTQHIVPELKGLALTTDILACRSIMANLSQFCHVPVLAIPNPFYNHIFYEFMKQTMIKYYRSL
ncbi:LRR receptor kinase SERL2 [Bienertia sinuspersici]